ncbi:MAG: hypothetical protein ACK56I_05130, partial [bacterium]
MQQARGAEIHVVAVCRANRQGKDVAVDHRDLPLREFCGELPCIACADEHHAQFGPRFAPLQRGSDFTRRVRVNHERHFAVQNRLHGLPGGNDGRSAHSLAPRFRIREE